jgi:hypothetical protein
MTEWLTKNGYDRIRKVPSGLVAHHAAKWRLVLLPSGATTIVSAFPEKRAAWIEEIHLSIDRFVRDMAMCLFFAEPLFTVNLVGSALEGPHGGAPLASLEGRQRQGGGTLVSQRGSYRI